MADNMIRILLVEDHAFTRSGLRATLNLEVDFHVVIEARGGEEALERLSGTEVDVAVVDIGLPGMDGIQTAAEIGRGWPGIKTVMLTAHDRRQEVFAALASGAAAYCLKSSRPELLFLAVRAAAAGGAYLDPQVAYHILGGVRAPGALPLLTSRELEVLRLIAAGLPNKDIAIELEMSVSTVKQDVQELLVKLQAADRTHAAVKALRQGLL